MRQQSCFNLFNTVITLLPVVTTTPVSGQNKRKKSKAWNGENKDILEIFNIIPKGQTEFTLIDS